MNKIQKQIVACSAFASLILCASCAVQMERTNKFDEKSDDFVGYKVIYDANGAVGGEVPPVERYKEGEIVTVAGNPGNLIRNAFSVIRWNTAADGSGTGYTAGGDTFTMGDEAITLYADWDRWTKQFGVENNSITANGICGDENGIYITGLTFGDLDGQTVTGIQDVYIIKYNLSGYRLWTRLLGVESQTTVGKGIAIDADGNCFVTGQTDGNLDGEFYTGPNNNVFVVKYDSSGNKQWTRLSGVASKNTCGLGISADNNGNCYITGYTDGDLDGETLAGIYDMFVIKYDKSGSKKWTKLTGLAGSQTSATGISADTDGNCYITGGTSGGIDLQPLTGFQDLFIIKFDTSGNKNWTKLMGVFGNASCGLGISAVINGNIFVTGQTDGNLDGQMLTGSTDAFIIKYDISGEKKWTRLIGAASATTIGNDISIDPNGYCYITGQTDGAIGGNPLNGNTDLFFVKYDSSGNRQYLRLFGAAVRRTEGFGIYIDVAGNSYIAGTTDGKLDGQTLTGYVDAFVTTRLND